MTVCATNGKGLLFTGDCKLAALANRAHIHWRGHYYLTPLAQVGEVPAQLDEWVRRALDGDVRLLPLTADDGTPWGEPRSDPAARACLRGASPRAGEHSRYVVQV